MQKKITLMVQGTSSDAGKSLLVAGLCRYFSRLGYAAAPFKPQNMALNSAVTLDGGEIGRAQALQAFAAGIEPSTDMNPILLKPNSETGAQVIVSGEVYGNMDANSYHTFKPKAFEQVLAAYNRLASAYDLVLVEGAGSPAEINLRENDVANMGFAEAVDCPVILVADIERGGVFAQLLGTLAVLSESECKRIIGFVINRFRGDMEILKPGIQWLESRTDKPVFGVLPYLKDLHLDAEDSLNLNQGLCETKGQLSVVVLRLPTISNHTDFDPLKAHPEVNLKFVSLNESLPSCDLVIIPGCKNVCADLKVVLDQGWQKQLTRHLRYGGKVLGICGGYQMLGESVEDPFGIEGSIKYTQGLHLLPVLTQLKPQKKRAQVQGVLNMNAVDVAISGYEIHHGETNLKVEAIDQQYRQPIRLEHGIYEGCVSEDQQILGTYLHGLFEAPQALDALLAWAGLSASQHLDYNQMRDEAINKVADALKQAMNLDDIQNPLFRALELHLG